MREEQIADFFGQLGPIKKSKKRGKEGDPTIHLYMDKRTQRPKGDCTVSFDESETAKAAIKWYDGKCFGVSRHPHRAAARAFFFPAVALPRSPRPLTAQNLANPALRLQPYSSPPPPPPPARTSPTRSCPSRSPSDQTARASARGGAREGARAIELVTLRTPRIISHR